MNDPHLHLFVDTREIHQLAIERVINRPRFTTSRSRSIDEATLYSYRLA